MYRNAIDVDGILRKWLPTIRKKVDPKEVCPSIRGLTDFDRICIDRAYDREGQQIAADRMVEAVRRRDQRSGFLSFLAALYEHNYEDLANQILAFAELQNHQPILNALQEEKDRIAQPQVRSNVATAMISPIQNPINRQINNPPLTYQNPHQHGFHQFSPNINQNMPSGLQIQTNQQSMGFQIIPNQHPQPQYVGTQLYQQYPSNHGNQDIQYPTSCNVPALPQVPSPDQATNNSQIVPQSNIPPSGEQNILDSDINSLPFDEFEKLVETLNEKIQPGWIRLAREFKVPRGKVKEFEKSENPAEELLDYLNEKKITIGKLKCSLQSAGLDSAIKCIQCEDLPSEDGNQGTQTDGNSAAMGDNSKGNMLQNLSLPDQMTDGIQQLYSRESSYSSSDQTIHSGSSSITPVLDQNRDDRSHSTMSADNQQDRSNIDENGSFSVSPSSDRHSSSSLNIDPSRNSSGSTNISSDRRSSGSNNTSSDRSSSGSYNTSSDRSSSGSYDTSSDRRSSGSNNTSSNRSNSGLINTNNIPIESENRCTTQNSLENNITPPENDVFNNLDRQIAKKDVPDKNVSTDNQPAATKSDSVATNTQTVQEAGSGKIVGNGAIPSEDPLQSYTSQSSSTSAVNNKLNGEAQTTDSSDVKNNNTQSEQPTAQTRQLANFSSEAFNSMTEQADSIVSQHESTSSLLEDGEPNSQNESLEQKMSSSLDNDVKPDSTEYGIQATSIGINTDNPNIPGPLTFVLSGNSDEKQDEKVPLESPSGNISKDKIKEKSTDEEAEDDQVGIPVTSLDGRTDNPYIPEPLTKAMSDNDKESQNKTSSVGPNGEANAEKKNASSLGGTTEKHKMPEGISGTEDEETQTKTTTGQQQRPETDPTTNIMKEI